MKRGDKYKTSKNRLYQWSKHRYCINGMIF